MTVVDGEWRTTYGNQTEITVMKEMQAIVSRLNKTMIDISYENTIGHALSFFLSGVLCFVISAIYSYVEKKYKNSTETNVN